MERMAGEEHCLVKLMGLTDALLVGSEGKRRRQG